MSSPELDLLVAWRVGRNVHAGPIDVSGDVVGEFLSLTEVADATLAEPNVIANFDPDAEYDGEDRQVLRANVSDIVDFELIQLLLEAHVYDYLTDSDLEAHRPYLYALSTVKDDERIVYVRATSPVKFPGKSIRGRLTDSFDRISEPILVFDSYFDFVVRGNEILIFNASSFERITNSPEAAAAASHRLLASLVSSLPIAEQGREPLREYLARNSFARRKALSVSNKPYLIELTPDRISDALVKHELNPSDYVVNGELAFTPENARTLLALLNDDVFSGDFSGVEYTASRKSALS